MPPSNEKAAVLDYWRSIELFSPQSIPKAAPNDQKEPVYSAIEPKLVPWDNGHPLKSGWAPSKMARRFLVYSGVFSLSKVTAVLEEKLGRDPEAFDERMDGESCVFAFSVTDDGRPLFDTFTLSTCAWATGRTLQLGPTDSKWLSNFEQTEKNIADAFADRYAVREDDERGLELTSKGFKLGRPITCAEILEETQRITRELGLESLKFSGEIRIRARLVAAKTKYSAEDQDFLNSFFVKDLGKIADAVRRKDIGKALSTFLSSTKEFDTSKRIDVRKSMATLFQQLSPSLFPSGRWPSVNHLPLVFSQQVAINTIKEQLGTSTGLFSVNGPPGTGKTTLLRDLVADVIVERAKKLADLTSPENAFSGEKRWKVGQFTRVISIWKAELRGFEMVVASNNNGAVENVTLEIPGKHAVDKSIADTIDHFADYASKLIDQPAWALIAAKLGNKTNRNEFSNRFWYGGAGDEDDGVPNSDAGFLKLLKFQATQPTVSWSQAVTQFKKAVEAERVIKKRREQIFAHYQESFLLAQTIPSLQADLDRIESDRATSAGLLLQDDDYAQSSHLLLEATKQQRFEHRAFRPGLLEILLSFGKAFREWRQKDLVHAARIEACESQCRLALGAVRTQKAALDAIVTRQATTAQNLQAKIVRLEKVKVALNEASQLYGEHFPEPRSWAAKESSREQSSPWADDEWNAARTAVFTEALALHKAFVLANPDVMRKNLQAAMDILGGAVPENAPIDAVEAAWSTLFFIVPVISTTFASFDRLFSHLGRESLGWLLIDEAGQAVPQSAAGAIWRARRAVVVGDPLQLEPVVTIPMTAQESLRQHYQVEEVWVPGRTSVQQLADRSNKLGTYVATADGPIWVGAPLRVHRRCDQQMFDISNRVAYDGMMVFGTGTRQQLVFPDSSWIDVVGSENDSHWIPAEGRAVRELIHALMNDGAALESIFLISPFRRVVRELRDIANDFKGVKSGTVHTVQGKEADIVIFVLGGDPQRPGAKQWASARPNLLNVAVSRAKRRLYVVGNRDAWKSYPYFSTCAQVLA